MSVLVKGMKMPNSCTDCYFKYVMIDNYVGCDFDRTLLKIGNNGRRDDCQLFELPKHGRLIDADVVSWQFLKQYANGKRVNFASDFVLEAERAYKEAQEDG